MKHKYELNQDLGFGFEYCRAGLKRSGVVVQTQFFIK